MSHIIAEVTQGCHSNHRGSYDINTDHGTPLYAPRTATVARREDAGADSYGWYLRLDSPGGVDIYLAHLSRFYVNVGQDVLAGQLVALSGGNPGSPGAGNSSGSHLHFEVRVNGVHVACSRVDNYIGSLFHPKQEEDDEVVLIRIGGEATVYACLWGFKVAVPNKEVFAKMGGDWSKVYGVNKDHPLAKLPTLTP